MLLAHFTPNRGVASQGVRPISPDFRLFSSANWSDGGGISRPNRPRRRRREAGFLESPGTFPPGF